MLIIYRRASEQLFYLVFISDTIYISSLKECQVRNVSAYVFTTSLPNGVYLVYLCIADNFSILVILL